MALAVTHAMSRFVEVSILLTAPEGTDLSEALRCHIQPRRSGPLFGGDW